ncbi:MAG: hypothetical protein LIO46_07180, partial [Clostridiales bacterium]|nr:hypothetical protein [Clostridiales bacterium]
LDRLRGARHADYLLSALNGPAPQILRGSEPDLRGWLDDFQRQGGYAASGLEPPENRKKRNRRYRFAYLEYNALCPDGAGGVLIADRQSPDPVTSRLCAVWVAASLQAGTNQVQ